MKVCSSREGRAPKDGLSSIPQRCKFQWKLSLLLLLHLGNRHLAPGVPGRAWPGRGRRAPSPEWQVGPRPGLAPPSPRVRRGGGRGESGTRAAQPPAVDPVEELPSDLLQPSPFFPDPAVELESDREEPRRDLRGLGQEPALLPRGTQRRWWLRVHVLRTRHKLCGLSRDTCGASAAPRREEEPRQGSGTRRLL